MKRYIACIALAAAAVFAVFAGGAKEKDGRLRIGIAKIVAHPALDQIEMGIQDELAAEGIDAVYDLQNANGDPNTAAQIANKYKSDKVDIAVGIATPVAVALANAITDVPVVFATVTDPVGAGLVTTVDHGEGNVTGLSDMTPIAEHIKMFKEIAGIGTLGYIYTSSEANSISGLELVTKACEENGLKLVTQAISNSSEVKQAAEAIIDRVDGIYLTTDNTVFSALPALIDVAGRARKPIFSSDVTAAVDGGCVIASGFNYYKAGRATGKMIADIINGKKPAEMPVKFLTDPSETDLLFDLDAAARCGIVIPAGYIDAANMIYENGKLAEK